VVSTARPTSFFPRHRISLYNTRLPEYRSNNSYNYILDDFVNGLTKESDSKDSKNVTDKGKAENYSNGSNNSNNTDNNDSGDGNSSNNDEDNEARGCIGRRGLPTPINS